MPDTTMRRESWADVVNLLLGVWLFLTPWLFGFTGEGTASLNAWIAGILIAALGLAALTTFAEWEEWIELLAGIWVAVSPWLLGFTAVTAAMGWHVIVGVVVAILAAVRVYYARQHPGRLAT